MRSNGDPKTNHGSKRGPPNRPPLGAAGDPKFHPLQEATGDPKIPHNETKQGPRNQPQRGTSKIGGVLMGGGCRCGGVSRLFWGGVPRWGMGGGFGVHAAAVPCAYLSRDLRWRLEQRVGQSGAQWGGGGGAGCGVWGGQRSEKSGETHRPQKPPTPKPPTP